MQRHTLLPHTETIQVLLHAKIRPISQTYTLKDFFHSDGPNLKKICKDYLKSRRLENFREPAFTLKSNLSCPDLKRLRNVLKAQKSLSQILYSLETSSSTKKERRLFFLAVKRSSCLSSLTLASCNPRLLTFLFANLASLKKLKELKFLLSFDQTQAKKVFPRWMKFLKRMKTLANLSLKFNNMQAFDNFLPGVQKFPQLRVLQIKVFEREDLETCTASLAPILPRLIFLQKFILSFAYSTIPDSSAYQLFAILQSLKMLSSLKLGFLNDFKGGQKSFSECLESFDHTQIRELRFKFNGNYHQKKLIQLSQALEKFTNLKSLQLHFSQCYSFKQPEMLMFSTALSSLVLLESLNLYFYSRYTNNLLLQNIASALRSLCRLVRLKLHFCCHIQASNDDVQQLFTNLKDLKSLQCFVVDFTSRIAITDKELEILSQSLTGLVLLKDLRFYFPGTKQITNQGIEAIANAVQCLKKLSNLELMFGDLCKVDEEGICKIGEALQNLRFLSSVLLNLRGLSKGKNLANFFTELKQIKSQAKISIDLPKFMKSCCEEGVLLRKENVNEDFM